MGLHARKKRQRGGKVESMFWIDSQGTLYYRGLGRIIPREFSRY